MRYEPDDNIDLEDRTGSTEDPLPELRVKLLVSENKQLKEDMIRLKAMLFHYTGKME